jgi:hypothetical protein
MCRQSATVSLVKSPTRQHRLIGPPTLRPRTLPTPGIDAGSVTRS